MSRSVGLFNASSDICICSNISCLGGQGAAYIGHRSPSFQNLQHLQPGVSSKYQVIKVEYAILTSIERSKMISDTQYRHQIWTPGWIGCCSWTTVWGDESDRKMLFTGTGKYSGGLWECSMIGVEDRHDMIGGDKWRSPKHHRFPLSSVGVEDIFFRSYCVVGGWELKWWKHCRNLWCTNIIVYSVVFTTSLWAKWASWAEIILLEVKYWQEKSTMSRDLTALPGRIFLFQWKCQVEHYCPGN